MQRSGNYGAIAVGLAKTLWRSDVSGTPEKPVF